MAAVEQGSRGEAARCSECGRGASCRVVESDSSRFFCTDHLPEHVALLAETIVAGKVERVRLGLIRLRAELRRDMATLSCRGPEVAGEVVAEGARRVERLEVALRAIEDAPHPSVIVLAELLLSRNGRPLREVA